MADGPDSSSLPGRLAVSDDDAEFESFFRAGEEGTYKEGPSESLAPLFAEVDLEEPEEDFYERHEAQLERRDRYRRYVSRGMGSLGAGLALALAVRAVGVREPEAALPLASPVLAVAELPAPAALPASAPVPEPAPPAAVEPAAVEPAAVEPAAVEPGGVETFEEVIVAGDAPTPKKATPQVPAKIVPPVTRGRAPAAAAQLPSSGLDDAASGGTARTNPAPVSTAAAPPKARASHPRPAPSAAPPTRSLSLGGLQVVGAPASPIFQQTPPKTAP